MPQSHSATATPIAGRAAARALQRTATSVARTCAPCGSHKTGARGGLSPGFNVVLMVSVGPAAVRRSTRALYAIRHYVSRSNINSRARSNSSASIGGTPSSRGRSPVDSSVQRIERSPEPRQAFAPMRNAVKSATAAGGNPFASLADEATRTLQVSDELLGLARYNDDGATKAYQVPPELLVLTRRNKQAKAAAKQAESAAAAREQGADAQATVLTGRPPAMASSTPAPSAAENELPLLDAAAPAPMSATTPALEHASAAAFRGSKNQKQVARWVLTALCAMALCVACVVFGRMVREGQAFTSLRHGIGRLF
jgi:hypothetical protein